MKQQVWITLFSLATILLFSQCKKEEKSIVIKSPDSKIEMTFLLDKNGQPTYFVKRNEDIIIDTSKMGFEFTDMSPMEKNFKILSSIPFSQNEKWEMQWGEKREVLNIYNSTCIYLQEKSELKRRFNIYFKVYDDGIGFRYEFPEQERIKEALISKENTEFRIIGDPKCWWQPGDWDIYEHLYNTTKFSEIDALKLRNHKNLAQTTIPFNAVNTPITLKTENGFYLSFHEANLTDYAGMTLKVETNPNRFVSQLVGSKLTDYAVKRNTPFVTPWRTIQIAENAGDLIESDLIVNLNDANILGDISWFTPTKYVGIWWDMHLGTKMWDYASGRHGATTEYAKELIDFAAKNNIHGILVEGWNTGWEHWVGFEDREGIFDFVTPYPDYNLKEVVKYGRERGVELIMHHETSAAPLTYAKQMDTAYKLMESLGIHAVKTGYVGKLIPKGEYHHGQWMVNQYRKAVVEGAKHKIAINAHEPIKATGLRRTYPNIISREGLRGQEFNAWSSDGGNPPEHLSIVAYTRMLGGPIDYTPGIFNIKLDPYKKDNQVNTTLTHQLALYVVINSPIQMVPDLMEAYVNHPAFQFIRDVPVNWEQSKVLDGEIGDFIITARQDRASENWFVGAISDENPRDVTIDFSFLESGKSYLATFYKDGKNAHWNDNPTDYYIEKKKITSESKIPVHIAAGGGFAVSVVLE